MLVEDNPVNRKVAIGILERHNCDVTAAENGRVALEMLDQKSFDVVLMDAQMPDVDGFEATKRIRAIERWRELPIIAMTAHAMKGDRELCLEAGMDEYIAKPVRAKELFDTIGRVVGESESATCERPAETGDINMRAALDSVRGDSKLLREIAEITLQECPSLMNGVREAIAAADAEALLSQSHRLKSAVQIFGATSAGQHAKRLEEMGMERDLAAAGGPPPDEVLPFRK